MSVTFNDFLRGYPYTIEDLTNVDVVEFENGVVQKKDNWGRTKKVFGITFNVNSKTEILAIKDFFETQIGPAGSFSFTCPVLGTAFTVRFKENSFKIERRYYGTYYGSCALVEEF